MNSKQSKWFYLAFIPLLLISLLGYSTGADAHDSRPAYLELKETGQGYYSVLWRTPLVYGVKLDVELLLGDSSRDVTAPAVSNLPDSVVERRLIDVGEVGLIGQRIELAGLQATTSDVLTRIEFANGTSYTKVIKPDQPWLVVEGPRSGWQVAWDYTTLGVKHILSGFDHLLFVLALLLIVSGMRRLFLTITAFTLAHSITLAGAALGILWVPGPPVEATIALSILFLASEMVKVNRGGQSLTASYPWVVAFTFGLLHGLGFAGALTEVGLPQHEIPLALLMFNVGVELGQILFVAMIFGLMFFLRKICNGWPAWSRQVPAYGIGAMAAFWLIERVSGF
jgi:hypothetical protein